MESRCSQEGAGTQIREQTQEIENYIRNVEADIEAGKAVPRMDYEEAKNAGLVVEFNPLNEYIDSIISRINMQAIRDRGLRVALDPPLRRQSDFFEDDSVHCKMRGGDHPRTP